MKLFRWFRRTSQVTVERITITTTVVTRQVTVERLSSTSKYLLLSKSRGEVPCFPTQEEAKELRKRLQSAIYVDAD